MDLRCRISKKEGYITFSYLTMMQSLTMRQLSTLSEEQIVDRLADLYFEGYLESKTEISSYTGPFNDYFEETLYLELRVSLESIDKAYSIFSGKPTSERTPLAIEYVHFLEENLKHMKDYEDDMEAAYHEYKRIIKFSKDTLHLKNKCK